MQKIPTMFERVFDGHKIVDILPNFTNNDCEKALKIGVPTVKYDGAACAYIRGYLYKRFNFGKAKQIFHSSGMTGYRKKGAKKNERTMLSM